jgi:hypothetical protein
MSEDVVVKYSGRAESSRSLQHRIANCRFYSTHLQLLPFSARSECAKIDWRNVGITNIKRRLYQVGICSELLIAMCSKIEQVRAGFSTSTVIISLTKNVMVPSRITANSQTHKASTSSQCTRVRLTTEQVASPTSHIRTPLSHSPKRWPVNLY